MFKKVLIANRGEIAVRILRACRDMCIDSVAVFSDVDRAALHVRLADEAYAIGPAPSRESYLRVDKLMAVARRAHCDALHPGYGFLAENPALPRACADAGITFIGPPAAAMEQLGSKTAARELAHRVGIPMVPGVRQPIAHSDDAAGVAGEIGYPVLLKAVAGGGGKGMRMVADPAALSAAWRDAGSEALNAFGDARLYIERYLEYPRHIEVQIFADAEGRVVYLGERECSVQRRHQKVIEEAPSTFVTPRLRREMGEAAVQLARAAGYTNAGTVEFLVDAARNFYFLEVNTRLQVEHPVTEAVTGIDLVQWQMRVADGEPLPMAQDKIECQGHAIECRIYAEDPGNHFFPSPGKIVSWGAPQGPGIRLDEGVYEGWTISSDYDPLLAKLIAQGTDRFTALARMRRALREFSVGGVKTNVGLFVRILDDPEFGHGDFHTRWLDERLASLQTTKKDLAQTDAGLLDAVSVAAALWRFSHTDGLDGTVSQQAASKWKLAGRHEQTDRNPQEGGT